MPSIFRLKCETRKAAVYGPSAVSHVLHFVKRSRQSLKLQATPADDDEAAASLCGCFPSGQRKRWRSNEI